MTNRVCGQGVFHCCIFLRFWTSQNDIVLEDGGGRVTDFIKIITGWLSGGDVYSVADVDLGGVDGGGVGHDGLGGLAVFFVGELLGVVGGGGVVVFKTGFCGGDFF